MNPRDWPPPVCWLTQVHIYAYLDAAGDILYIGQSSDLKTRHGAHRQTSPWFAEATDFALICSHYNRRRALDAEAAAIRLYRPRYNVMHNRPAVTA